MSPEAAGASQLSTTARGSGMGLGPRTPGHVREREGGASAIAGLLFWWGDQPSEVPGSLGMEAQPPGVCMFSRVKGQISWHTCQALPPSPAGSGAFLAIVAVRAAMITTWCWSAR